MASIHLSVIGVILTSLIQLSLTFDMSANVENVLRASGFRGEIHPRGTMGYARYRRVRNGACNDRFPMVLIRPVNSFDVSLGVKAARLFGLPVSVRSGGHSYVCSSIKHDSLHFDLRRLNKVELMPQYYNDVSAIFRM